MTDDADIRIIGNLPVGCPAQVGGPPPVQAR